jgi:hypothetical protein
MDKGKGKMIELEKLKKVAPIPLQAGRAFKIYEPEAPVPFVLLAKPPKKKSLVLKKKPVEAHPRVARTLKPVDKEDAEVEQYVEAALRTTPQAPALVEESEVEVIEVPLVKKRKLKKATELAALVIEPTAQVIETATLVVKAVNVAGFLVAWRK